MLHNYTSNEWIKYRSAVMILKRLANILVPTIYYYKKKETKQKRRVCLSVDRVRQRASACIIKYVLTHGIIILYSISAESLDHAARKSNRTRCVRAEIAGRALIGGKSVGGAGIHVGRN